MRLRISVLACALTALTCAVAPSIAGAAPVHNRGLTIHAAPDPILAGEGVLIYGRLHGSGHANQMITLYHRINPKPFFTVIGRTRTNSLGEYEFTRVEGIVMTNRNWFVRGPGLTHSRTVHERVAALVSLSSSASSGTTRHPIVFSGHVTPSHTGSVVALQQMNENSGRWVTLKRGRVGAGSNYNISYAWRVPGAYDVRVLFTGDARNIAAPSDTVTVLVQQTEVTGFTINSSAPVVPIGQSATISGVLDQPGTSAPEPSTSVSLFARVPGSPGFHEVNTTTTGADGSYSFANVSSTSNELYQVRTTFTPHRATAVLFEGVQDAISMQSSSQTSTVDGTVTFSGSVSPDKSGHVVYLQRLGADNNWHTVAQTTVKPNSTYALNWTFGTAGTKTFRARITGGKVNIGNVSQPVTIAVTQPPLPALPNS